MIGIIVILTISWLLLYLFQKENLSVLGMVPTARRFLQFVVGFVFIILLKLVFILIETQIKSIEWGINDPISYKMLFQSLWYHLKSALTEDLIFRGAILYILAKRIGIQKGLLISGAAFGVYHWFSYGMIHSGVIPLAYILITTGFMGYVWGYAFLKTKSILMPLGFHLGWNFVMSLCYPSQHYGELLIKQLSRTDLSGWGDLYYSLFVGLIPPLIILAFYRSIENKSWIAVIDHKIKSE